MILAGLLALAAQLRPAELPRLATWRLEGDRLEAEPSATDQPLPVGSLQKPFVAKAWAQAHGDQPAPRFACAPGSGCWFRAGHGELGLAQAVAVSCNTYFLKLARDTPAAELAATLGGEGFAPAPLCAEDAIGLAGNLAIRPSALLAAYRRLVTAPWPRGAPVRTELLAGLRAAALTGTAAGIGHRGFWAKTGTIPAADGDPLATCGLAVAVADDGWAVLGRLRPGTGRAAAAALAAPLDRWRPWDPRRGPARPAAAADVLAAGVRVRLFEMLGRRRYQVRNLGTGPVPLGRGFLGPGAQAGLTAGAGPGLLELSAPGLRRVLQGQVALQGGTLVATLAPREYVAGVIAAELPGGEPDLRRELGAAVLRFLARGPRHPGADVCDNTHCAYFIGRGPRLDWRDPGRGTPLPAPLPGLGDDDWNAIQAAALAPGPDQWTAHCGGQPLAPRFLWGAGSAGAPPCPRHGPGADPWERSWPAAEVARAFGGPVASLAAGEREGVWTLTVTSAGQTRHLRYDEAHRLLAAVLGWDALPSPADAVTSEPDGFRVSGHGHGHRVGLCLASAGATPPRRRP